MYLMLYITHVYCVCYFAISPMPEFIDQVAKTSPDRLFSLTENERFGLVFAKNGSINSGTFLLKTLLLFSPIRLQCCKYYLIPHFIL
jgi:hypothetical protein